MLPESGFLFTEPKSVLHEHTNTGSKQKTLLQESRKLPAQMLGAEERAAPFQLFHGGFYFLRTGIPTWDLDIIRFSHWPCPITYIRPYSIRPKTGVLEVAMPYKFYGYFVLLSPRLGVSTLYIFLLTITCIGQGLMSTFT